MFRSASQSSYTAISYYVLANFSWFCTKLIIFCLFMWAADSPATNMIRSGFVNSNLSDLLYFEGIDWLGLVALEMPIFQIVLSTNKLGFFLVFFFVVIRVFNLNVILCFCRLFLCIVAFSPFL